MPSRVSSVDAVGNAVAKVRKKSASSGYLGNGNISTMAWRAYRVCGNKSLGDFHGSSEEFMLFNAELKMRHRLVE